jgi:hypothetical protein
MIGYPRKFSILVLVAYAAVLVVLVVSQHPTGAFLIGSILAALSDVRLYAFLFVGLILKNYLNPLFLSVLVALGYTTYLFLTLQEIWAELGKSPNFFHYWGIFLGTLFLLYSAINVAGVRFVKQKENVQ